MTRVGRMTQLADLAGDRTDEATRKLAERMRGVEGEEAQLAELERFRAEYLDAEPAATNVAALVNRRRFLDRINEAITFQHAQIARQKRLLEEERKRFLQVQAQSKALDNVVQRLTDEQRRVEDRHDQGEADERALQRAARDAARDEHDR
ncbi:flagellar export protein FliJ [Dokdonella sp. MW10]|uniref:flagellar export protein FliJ n=1 Tax=Dokdonella sp. MW10 TaxID=2992926 RepID=UPI003F7F4E98